MKKYNTINEGLTAHALDYLILPLITVDEYESKIDDRRVIVVGFYVTDYDPADDLSTFIDKSNLDILDTEISPAPTSEGHYVVFVEIRRNEEFPSVLLEILNEIKNLCTIDRWEMKCPSSAEPLPVTKDTLQNNLILDEDEIPNIPDEEDEDNEKDADEDIKELDESVNFWKSSVSDKIEIDKTTLSFHKNNEIYIYDIIPMMPSGALKLSEGTTTSKLQMLLGPGYMVWNIDDNLVVEHGYEYRILKSST